MPLIGLAWMSGLVAVAGPRKPGPATIGMSAELEGDLGPTGATTVERLVRPQDGGDRFLLRPDGGRVRLLSHWA
jgi:hypothetical protein